MAALAPTPIELRRRAQHLAAGYPALLAEAERVAAVVAQGVHGRRRPGQGETFWQYRNYRSSDSANQIDWRRSARGDQVFVRENEWEAANTVYFWRDGSEGMNWSSSKKLPTKQNRASVLCMAMTSLLMRAGERCAVMGESERARTGRIGQERISRRLALSEGPTRNLDADIPAYARLVIASDFLEAPDVWRQRIARLSGRPAKGILLHVIDPAEREFPFKGRVQLRIPGLSKLEPILVGRAEKAREEYQAKFNAHCEALDRTASRLGWPVIRHYTDKPANAALTALYTAMAESEL
ncbi:DUF58 domain-containing protein [Hellea sp.]|nr:DUF58 domain-containing protein [Hellea sp.]